MSKKDKKRGKEKRKEQGNALQKRIKKGQQRAAFGKSVINKSNVQRWNPGAGEHIIDILPYLAGKNDPMCSEGEETYTFQFDVHRQIGPGNAMVVCPAATYGKPCPICEDRQRLIDKGADDKVWKKLKTSTRNLYNIICYDRGEEEKGVQIWDVPFFYSEKHLLAIASKATRGGGTKFINFPHPKDGKNVTFKLVPAQSRNDYPSYEGFSFDDRDYKISKDLLEQVETLDELVHLPTYEEISELYYGESGSRGSDDEDESEEENEEEESEEKESGDEDSLDDIMEELDECEDIDDLKTFVDDYDINIKIRSKDKFKKKKKEVESLVHKKYGKKSSKKNKKEKDEKEMAVTKKQIKKMDFDELSDLIDDEDLDVDIDDYDEDDDDSVDDLRDAIIDEMDL